MALLPDADPLLILAVVLMGGVATGALSKRLRLPSVTGQIVAGIVLGHAGLSVFEEQSIEALHPLTHFALGLIAVTVGAHLNWRKLRNAGKRLGLLVVLESLLIPGLVVAGLMALGNIEWSVALLFGTIAISSAPATIVAVVKETRSKGVFVKTLIAAVALNNIACILLFELARVVAQMELGGADHSALQILVKPLEQLGEALLLGAAAAGAMELMYRLVSRPQMVATGGFITILLTSGAASYLGVSPLLACLFLGLIQANVTRDRNKIVDVIFTNFEPAILAIFFTLAGMELTLEHGATAGVLALVFFAMRLLGKVTASRLAMRLAGATKSVQQNLGMALVPQAGIAVGLVLLLEKDPILRVAAPELLPLFTAVVLTAVVANELAGPILARFALVRSGEVGRDRMRLINFLHEENIVTDLSATTKEGAIEQLVDVLMTSHHLDPSLRAGLLDATLEREAELSTCLGGGLAVPHGTLPDGLGMVGAMGLSRGGLDLDAPDGKRVHCMVLLATPDAERQRHVQVLAALARTVGSDSRIQTALFNALSPAHAYELLHNEESEDFNYFLDEAVAE